MKKTAKLILVTKKNRFTTLTEVANVLNFFTSSPTLRQNKLERFSHIVILPKVNCLNII
jgi:hypothetical protein